MQDQKIAFVFPGQGSQSIGMGHSLAMSFPSARDIYQHADEILGFSLSKIAWDGPEADLDDTINTQPALFIHSVAVLQVIHELGVELVPSFVAGHSMGEICALVASGSISFSDGLKLTRTRGELMKHAGTVSPGGMAAVMGLDIPVIEHLCAQASIGPEIVQVANDNCPGQVVISGAFSALMRVQPLLEDAGAKRIIRLAVSIAAHSPLMATAQEDFNKAVSSTKIKTPYIPTIGNVNARPLLDSSDIRYDLQNQLTHRVRWTESIQFLLSEGISEFIEIGSGSVLSGLIRRIDRASIIFSLGTPQDFNRIEQL